MGFACRNHEDKVNQRMTPNCTQPVKRKTAALLVLSLCVVTTFLGDAIPIIRGREIPSLDEFWRGVLGSIIFSWLLLPGGFLHVLFGYTAKTLPKWATQFSWGYWGIVLVDFAAFIWLRRCWILLGAAMLLLVGAAG